MTTNATPQVFLACLACYNDGTINGAWLDADDDELLQDNINARQLACGHVDNDWQIQDTEGFLGINVGENPSFNELAELARNIEEHGEAFALYVSHVGASWDDAQGFQEAYCGEFDSKEAYAEQLADDLGLIDSNATWPLSYIDWERAARDLFCGDYWMESGHVFRSI